MSKRISSKGPVSSNVKRLSRLDIPGGGQIEIQGDFAYIGHMLPPYGTSIVDVSDPRKPRRIVTIEFAGNDTQTHNSCAAKWIDRVVRFRPISRHQPATA